MGKVGRPRGPNNKETVISLRMDAAMIKRLDAYCKKMQIAKSEVLRRALDNMIKEDEEKQES